MKGFDACVLAMAPVFRDAGLKRPIHIVLSYDEETTCLGSRDIIARFGKDEPRPAAVIVGEPTMMKVADAHKSVATFRTVVTGHEAHSALPALGANAVAAAADVVSEIGRLARAYEEGPLDPRFTPPYSTLHVGMIRGGTARNILARECVFNWEFRGLPGVTTASALAKVQAFVDEVALPRLTRFVSGPSIVTTIEVDVPPLAADAGSVAETLALRLTRSNNAIAVSFATEAGHFQGAGLPTIVCGPGSIDMAHKPTNSWTRRSSSPAWNSSSASPRTCRADIRRLGSALAAAPSTRAGSLVAANRKKSRPLGWGWDGEASRAHLSAPGRLRAGRLQRLADRLRFPLHRPQAAGNPGAEPGLRARGLRALAAHRAHEPEDPATQERAELHPHRRWISRRPGQSRPHGRVQPTSRRLSRGGLDGS